MSKSKTDDFLFEIFAEEMPPKALLKLAQTLKDHVEERLRKMDLPFTEIRYFATPRRLAIYIKELAAASKDQVVDRKGPAKNAAFDKAGKPTPACIGFAKSCGVDPADLTVMSTPQGEWMAYKQQVPGKSVMELLPDIFQQAVNALPIPKRMRWGDHDVQFTRPVHSVVMLYGDEVIQASILGHQADQYTQGHRFLAPKRIKISHPASYVTQMAKDGFVMVDFNERQEKIKKETDNLVKKKFGPHARALYSSCEFLNEVTGLVEWPVAIAGDFAPAFLQLPREVLISSMEDHQRYFPVQDEQENLLPHFVTISNIASKDEKQVALGNERVLRARLADAAFFFETDKKEKLSNRIERLKGIVYQAKLGTLYEKTERLSALAAHIATLMGADPTVAKRAAQLAKADLTTNMVGEFPELQGVMGGYYATHDQESREVAMAIVEHYMPRFAGDKTPSTQIGQAVALADRIDTLTGAFGINQIPTGDKDPYGLRRAALGIIRTLIEHQINVDLKPLFSKAMTAYQDRLLNKDALSQILVFIQERLRAWYQEQNVPADVFASVAALEIYNPIDMHERIKAVQTFKKLEAAETLSVANKRVSNILTKYESAIVAKKVDPQFFDNSAEEELAKQLESKRILVAKLSESGKYEEVLLQLAQLRKPIDDFFDQVLVMTDDTPKRENRLLLLSNLRSLFLKVADIALLQ